MANNDNNHIQSGNSNASTATDQNTIASNALQDHIRDPEVTIGNMASQNYNSSTVTTEETSRTTPTPKVGYVVVPYTKRLSESLKNMWQVWDTNILQGHYYIKANTYEPKDQDPKDNRSGVIYSYKCDHITCSEEYIGETSRSQGRGTRSISWDPLLFMHTSSR